jgi:RimJ/RimL family protein N-acetyltransferase
VQVTLREPRESDLPLLEAYYNDRSRLSEFDDLDFREPGGSYRRWEEHGTLPRNLMVEVDGEFAGSVSWHPVQHGPNEKSVCWNVGISLFPEFRGRGAGTQAQAMLAEHLFATTTVNRLEASTDVENVAEQRALEKAGFTREGVLRGAQWRRGAFHDLVLYSRLRGQ